MWYSPYLKLLSFNETLEFCRFLYHCDTPVQGLNHHELPGKGGPVGVKVVTPRCYVKLDLIEFIQMVDDVSVKMGL